VKCLLRYKNIIKTRQTCFGLLETIIMGILVSSRAKNVCRVLMMFYNAASISLSGSNLNDVLMTDFN